MEKPTIFYFVHAHGNGHKATFNLLYPEFSDCFKVIAVATNQEVADYIKLRHSAEVILLPPKYPEGYDIPEHTFSQAFEATPYAVEPAIRAQAFAEAILWHRPRALYCDGVPELSILARSMGLPVVLVHLPGNISQDPTQVFAHELAHHIVAHFPANMEQEDYKLHSKTYYSGYLSRFSEVDVKQNTDENNVTILLGHDNYEESVLQNITQNLGTNFTIIGNKREFGLGKNCQQLGFVNNFAESVVGRRVVTAAGQNTIAELLSLGKALILLPEPRPYSEQQVHAQILAKKSVALLAREDFTPAEWKYILNEAKSFVPSSKNLVNPRGAKEIAQKMKLWYA